MIAALLIANGALFWRSPVDIFSLPRATLFVIAAGVLVALSAVRAIDMGHALVPRSPAVVLAAVFVLALAVTAAVGDYTMQAVLGPYTRLTGFAMYAAYAVLLGFVLRTHDQRSIAQVAWAGAGALAIVAGYGLVQIAGIDPLDWPQSEAVVRQFGRFNTDFSTLGNVDFSAAFAGITAPLALWGALSTGRTARRVACAFLVAAAGVYATLTGAFQGPVTFVAGCSLVAAFWLVERWRPWPEWSRRARRRLGAGAVALGLSALAVMPALASHAIGQLREADERLQFWETASHIWLDHPVTGGGIGVFAREFTSRRPAEHATEREFQSADAPHNVVLELLAGGGLLAVVPYLGLVGFTGWILVRGLRTTRGETRLLLAAFGGAWLAYQLQSMVSIDVPALAVLHWITTGAILVIAAPPKLVPKAIGLSSGRGGRDAAMSPRQDGGRWPKRLAQLAVIMAGMAGVWLVSQPLRADLEAGRARRLRAHGDLEASLAKAERATDLAPWQASYWALKAGALDQLGDLPAAFVAGTRAAREAPWNATYALAVGGIAERRGDTSAARTWLAEALGRDPHNPEVLRVAARFNLKEGSARTAARLLTRAVDLDPTDAESWSLLGAAQHSLGDEVGARQAYTRALELDPDDARAAEALGRT